MGVYLCASGATTLLEERPIKVLLVESDREYVDVVRNGLTDARTSNIEVESASELSEALSRLSQGGIDAVLLDNMEPLELARAVAMRDTTRPEMLLEASGGVRLDTIQAIAETGVDRIAVGAITHSAVQVDFGLDLK